METLNKVETVEFLESFLKGLLEVGLLEPLQNLEKSQTAKIKAAAGSLYAALVEGHTPQVAVGLMSPRFPSRIESLIVRGFEQSSIDFVLSDIINAYKSLDDNEKLNKAFGDILDRHSSLKTKEICIECWTNEVQKILKRANTELSEHVILSFENGYLVQKFISTKLVTIIEPSIPAAYDTLKTVFNDLAKLGIQNPLGVNIKEISENRYQMISSVQSLTILFAD